MTPQAEDSARLQEVLGEMYAERAARADTQSAVISLRSRRQNFSLYGKKKWRAKPSPNVARTHSLNELSFLSTWRPTAASRNCGA